MTSSDTGTSPQASQPAGGKRARVESVNVAQPSSLQVGARTITTGIRKRAVSGRVAVTAAGLAGDHVLNRRHHGGPDQAVYVYTRPDLDFWAEALGEAPEPGLFGENLLLSRWASAELRVGDRLDFHPPSGEAGPLLEVTAPRIPCATLAANLHEPAFVKRFARARRPGAYMRVLRSGEVGVGDPVTLLPGDVEAPTLGELFDLHYVRTPDLERVRELLAFPLAIRVRRDLEAHLADGA
ncbi:MOSC domain-containing protein [Deinococcus koreensis]|uniref:MOSC domain-containing protein n=1 Tax=Deinococcus koreensis TaxID=2054903 RepID=A0A2K3V156_9DEIO|nr:MOSC domain-containing protein [Deinococcus koreensis]PNY82516.1 MOSC domain-containing protein [Deinococcus koreensis]